uniref:Uncharacterized protein n=1 Tax=Trypanosoma congolense (strain IL3000) TaxID=1068625 RepID=F9W933_TRYCI|nr:hypothetical protein, unlikely [Trypanosoma congolense IL3000]CCD13723.1 hypothetical protein, unlikely [Trypanosoma congolense IL3000]
MAFLHVYCIFQWISSVAFRATHPQHPMLTHFRSHESFSRTRDPSLVHIIIIITIPFLQRAKACFMKAYGFSFGSARERRGNEDVSKNMLKVLSLNSSLTAILRGKWHISDLIIRYICHFFLLCIPFQYAYQFLLSVVLLVFLS